VDYRFIDPDEVGRDTLRANLREVAVQQYQAALRSRLNAILAENAASSDDRRTFERQCEAARREERELAAKVERKNRDGLLTPEELRDLNRRLVEQWMQQLEVEHARHSARLTQRTTSLHLSGKLAASDRDKARLEGEIASHERDMRILEAAHTTARGILETLRS
jgi:hypothetical protein